MADSRVDPARFTPIDDGFSGELRMSAVPTRRILSVIAAVLAVIASAAVLTACKTSPIGRPGRDPSISPIPRYLLIASVSCVPRPVNLPDLTDHTHSDQSLRFPVQPSARAGRVTKYTSAAQLDLHWPSNRIHPTMSADAVTLSGAPAALLRAVHSGTGTATAGRTMQVAWVKGAERRQDAVHPPYTQPPRHRIPVGPRRHGNRDPALSRVRFSRTPHRTRPRIPVGSC